MTTKEILTAGAAARLEAWNEGDTEVPAGYYHDSLDLQRDLRALLASHAALVEAGIKLLDEAKTGYPGEVITDQMIDAGVHTLTGLNLDPEYQEVDWRATVRSVYASMRAALRST